MCTTSSHTVLYLQQASSVETTLAGKCADLVISVRKSVANWMETKPVTTNVLFKMYAKQIH